MQPLLHAAGILLDGAILRGTQANDPKNIAYSLARLPGAEMIEGREIAQVLGTGQPTVLPALAAERQS
jgi:hypothetical protein